MSYQSALTKQQLLDWGFLEPIYLEDGWHIYRNWPVGGRSKTPVVSEVKITEAIGKHKYTEDKKYLKIAFSVKKHGYTITLSRFIYAWFNGDIPERFDIEHLDNNPYNNMPENLALSTRGANLAKRYLDNPNGFNRNQ